ncbi:MAG: DUF1294 domain-containing protein [Oscillospiraceae bacterium]|nr:DUF1294 domain-containing protein [Oscillospiraceae bacterium]
MCFLIYVSVVSLITVILTVYDKWASRHNTKHRVPENVLMLIGILGGAVAEYVTMCLIRHKTKHKRFMIGLPVIIIMQFAVVIWVSVLIMQNK